MSGGLALDDFIEVTRNIARGSDEFLPTFADPVAREIKALDDVPDDADIATVTREWAAGQGRHRYIIAYSEGGEIKAEEYEAGKLIAARPVN